MVKMSGKSRVLLLQLREREDVERQEQRCFIERCGIEAAQLDPVNLLRDTPVAWDRVNAADAVVIGGSGIHSATDDHPFTGPLMETVRRICDQGKPFFGSCWGHQFLARALGGQVVTDHSKGEVGTHQVELTAAGQADPLFKDLGRRFAVQMGHNDYVRALPPGAVELVVSDICPNQAFRLAGKPIYGAQFHTELSVERLIERVGIYRDIYLSGDDGFEQLRRETRPTPEADRMLRRFMELYVLG